MVLYSFFAIFKPFISNKPWHIWAFAQQCPRVKRVADKYKELLDGLKKSLKSAIVVKDSATIYYWSVLIIVSGIVFVLYLHYPPPFLINIYIFLKHILKRNIDKCLFKSTSEYIPFFIIWFHWDKYEYKVLQLHYTET